MLKEGNVHFAFQFLPKLESNEKRRQNFPTPNLVNTGPAVKLLDAEN
jgi:hypothetical protein